MTDPKSYYELKLGKLTAADQTTLDKKAKIQKKMALMSQLNELVTGIFKISEVSPAIPANPPVPGNPAPSPNVPVPGNPAPAPNAPVPGKKAAAPAAS